MSSIATASLRLLRSKLPAKAFVLLNVNATSEAVSFDPSWNFTSSLILKVQVRLSSLTLYSVARSFSIEALFIFISLLCIRGSPYSPQPVQGSRLPKSSAAILTSSFSSRRFALSTCAADSAAAPPDVELDEDEHALKNSIAHTPNDNNLFVCFFIKYPLYFLFFI